MLKNITYTKKDGEVTDRVVHVISPVSNSMLAIDLSIYSTELQKRYDESLTDLHRRYLDDIAELGLADNWRRFNEEGIENA